MIQTSDLKKMCRNAQMICVYHYTNYPILTYFSQYLLVSMQIAMRRDLFIEFWKFNRASFSTVNLSVRCLVKVNFEYDDPSRTDVINFISSN